MKHTLKACLTCIFILLAAKSFTQLKVTVNEIKMIEGTLLIALYNSKKSFNHAEKVFRKGRVQITDKTASYTFEDLPAGDYALSVFHDSNDNNALDKTDFGIPIEPYGFSNNAFGTFGPPTYKKARFRFQGKPMEELIKIK